MKLPSWMGFGAMHRYCKLCGCVEPDFVRPPDWINKQGHMEGCLAPLVTIAEEAESEGKTS